MEEEQEKEFFTLLPDELLLFNKEAGFENLSDSKDAGKNPQVTEESPLTTGITKTFTASMSLGFRLNLRLIAHNIWNVKCSSKRLTMMIRKPRTTATLHSSGTIVFTGTESEELARVGARRCLRKLQRIGLSVQVQKLQFRLRVTNPRKNADQH